MKILKPLLLLLFLTALLFPSSSAFASPPAQQVLPPEGWQLCQDLGMVNIPGIGDRQLFQMCQGEGWEVQAYCLDPACLSLNWATPVRSWAVIPSGAAMGFSSCSSFNPRDACAIHVHPDPDFHIDSDSHPDSNAYAIPTATGQQPTPGPDTPVRTLPSARLPADLATAMFFLSWAAWQPV